MKQWSNMGEEVSQLIIFHYLFLIEKGKASPKITGVYMSDQVQHNVAYCVSLSCVWWFEPFFPVWSKLDTWEVMEECRKNPLSTLFLESTTSFVSEFHLLRVFFDNKTRWKSFTLPHWLFLCHLHAFCSVSFSFLVHHNGFFPTGVYFFNNSSNTHY